jgi:hypothetical protein
MEREKATVAASGVEALRSRVNQREGGRDAFWIFFAAYIVLLTTGKAPKDLALVRVGSTLFGVVALAVASYFVPDRVLFSLGIVILFAGVGLSPAYVIVGGAVTSIGSSSWRERRPETWRAGPGTAYSTRCLAAR